MNNNNSQPDMPRSQDIAERAFASIERFFHIEAISGIFLLFATAIALIWANSHWAESYFNLWHAQLSIGLGKFELSKSLHFLINDALMTFFFLVVGMEIRREIHDGALSNVKQAVVPVAAALGGVIVPALIYLTVNAYSIRENGWAIPTATDIAFAVGVLALLGRSIPGNVRIFLLTLAIIDDIIAVVVIAVFYSGGLHYGGFIIAGLGMMLVLGFQRIGIGSAFGYLLPGAIVWIGILMTGAHPALAGVVLGFMTPVLSMPMREHPLKIISRERDKLMGQNEDQKQMQSLRKIQRAQRELLPPIVRVEKALHPWVAYIVMPVFALANAGVSLSGDIFSVNDSMFIVIGIILALVIGKPLGILGMSWISVRLGFGELPSRVTWMSIGVIGLLAGIGFTMSIFIAILAFDEPSLLSASKLGVLIGSFAAAILGLILGKLYYGSTAKENSRGSGPESLI